VLKDTFTSLRSRRARRVGDPLRTETLAELNRYFEKRRSTSDRLDAVMGNLPTSVRPRAVRGAGREDKSFLDAVEKTPSTLRKK